MEFTLGQLQYQTDLTDADVVAFGQGQIQTQIQGSINQCLDRPARNLSPLDFAEFSDCASQFKTEALTDANNDVEEFSTPPPANAPGNGDFSSDGTVLTALTQHGLDQGQDLAYLLGILHKWYGIGTDPATLSSALVNPAVWSEVSLAYRELLDEYPQFSAGTEPDLASIEAPGQQVTQLVSAIQQVDPTTFTNPAVQQLTGNYSAAFTKLITDINAHQAAFPANATGAAGGYGTPSGQSWDGYNAFAGTDQPVPAGDDKNPAPTSLPNCANSNTVGLSGPMTWESAASLPNSYFLLDNLAGFSNGALQPLSDPLCYTFSAVTSDEVCRTVKGVTTCTFTVTDSGSLEVRFEGTDGNVHVLKTYTLPPASFDCNDKMVCQASPRPASSPTASSIRATAAWLSCCRASLPPPPPPTFWPAKAHRSSPPSRSRTTSGTSTASPTRTPPTTPRWTPTGGTSPARSSCSSSLAQTVAPARHSATRRCRTSSTVRISCRPP